MSVIARTALAYCGSQNTGAASSTASTGRTSIQACQCTADRKPSSGRAGAGAIGAAYLTVGCPGSRVTSARGVSVDPVATGPNAFAPLAAHGARGKWGIAERHPIERTATYVAMGVEVKIGVIWATAVRSKSVCSSGRGT
ncbi:hypothetical protein GCM10023204_21960 [Actinomycetospora succinea]